MNTILNRIKLKYRIAIGCSIDTDEVRIIEIIKMVVRSKERTWEIYKFTKTRLNQS